VNSRSWLWRAAQVVIIVAVVYGIYRLLAPELRQLTAASLLEWRPGVPRLLLSLVILVGFYFVHAFLWRAIVRDLGVGTPDVRTTVRVYFLASLGRYIPGKLWQLAGFAVLAGKAGLSPGGATAAAVLGQFGFLATGLLFVAVVLPDWTGGVGARVLGAILVGIAGFIWIITATPTGRRARAWMQGAVGGRAGEKLAATFELAERIRGRDAIRWAVGYGFSWILLGLAFSLFTTSFVPAAAAYSTRLAGSVAAGYLAGYVVLVAPGGIGVREAALTGLLATIPAIPIGAAVVVGVLSRIWFTIAELLPLALLPLMPASTTDVSRAGPDAGSARPAAGSNE
jgi:hypothetical protein